MIDTLVDGVRGLPPFVAVMLLAMLPVTELRGAIPVGMLLLDMAAPEAFAAGVLGNMLVVPVVVGVLEPATDVLRKVKLFDRIITWLFERTRRKLEKRFERLRAAALYAFVAVPIPGTGSWSGAFAAYVFGVPAKTAIVMILAGVATAGVVVTVLVASGVTIVELTS